MENKSCYSQIIILLKDEETLEELREEYAAIKKKTKFASDQIEAQGNLCKSFTRGKIMYLNVNECAM